MDAGSAETVKCANCMGREGKSVPGLVEGKEELQWRGNGVKEEKKVKEPKNNGRA
jgi:hypothetical protein